MNPIIKRAGKYLPLFIREPLTQLFKKLNSKIIWDEELMRDLMEKYNLSYDETKCMLKLGRRLFCDSWNKLNPKNEKEVSEFYKMPLPYNVFSLSFWHMSRGQRIFCILSKMHVLTNPPKFYHILYAQETMNYPF